MVSLSQKDKNIVLGQNQYSDFSSRHDFKEQA